MTMGAPMTTRRNFLISAALAGLPLMAGASSRALASAPVPGNPAIGALLIDDRHAAARAVGSSLAARGTPVRALDDGDVTSAWLHDVAPLWKRGPQAIAGLTEPSALFVLEQLAFAHRMRLAFHVEHTLAADGTAKHELLHCTGMGSTLSTRQLEFLGPLWPGRVASVIATWAEQPSAGRTGPSCTGLAPDLPPGAVLLTSWIIAPV